MKVKWSPVRSQERVEYSQPSPDVLLVKPTPGAALEADMSDAAVVAFDVPSQLAQYVLEAHREAGILHVTLLRPYTEGEKAAWETPPYRGQEYEDYGVQEVLR